MIMKIARAVRSDPGLGIDPRPWGRSSRKSRETAEAAADPGSTRHMNVLPAHVPRLMPVAPSLVEKDLRSVM